MVKIVDPSLCVRCKGRLLCGLSRCPILEQWRRIPSIPNVGAEIEAPSPPSIFVGWKNYPLVEISPVEALKNVEIAENPNAWKNMRIEDIIDVRLSLVRPFLRTRAESAADPSYELMTVQEVAMARKPTAVEAVFLKKPRFYVDFGGTTAPMGPKGPAKKLELQENPRVDQTVEKIYYDEMKVEEAVLTLFQQGKDVYELTRYLSAGLLGVPRRRKFVPTRWAITAVDDMLSRALLKEVRSFDPISNIMLFESHLFDNHFYIILFPGPWSFELMEAWAPGSAWLPSGNPVIVSDYEGPRGRTDYAENVGGSYYATKLAVLERLKKTKRVASVLVLREVHEGYYAPLGVWQVRENVREALRGRPKVFEGEKELWEYLAERLRIPVRVWKEQSKLFRMLGQHMLFFGDSTLE